MAKKQPDYRVDRLAVVDEQMRALAAKAAAAGIREYYLQSLHAVLERLRTQPLEWGDPDWRTQRPGGTVCHGLLGPLLVKYAVFEPDRVVLMLDLSPLPRSPLA